MLILYELIISGDNPIQVEECSHDGFKCNYFCCMYKVGGTNEEKKADKGYSNIFQVFSKLSTLDKLITSISVWWAMYTQRHLCSDQATKAFHALCWNRES